jgi:hypothetical protein
MLLSITYFTTEPATPPSRPLFLSIANTTFEIQCNLNITLTYRMKKAELSLPFRPIPYVNLRAYDALL